MIVKKSIDTVDSMQAICHNSLNHINKGHEDIKVVIDMCGGGVGGIGTGENIFVSQPSSPMDKNHNDTTVNCFNVPTNSIDLFPTHSTTWQQHPMNSQEHAHLRLDLNTTSKLLLQGSDDPLICCGANDDVHDEDHPLEFKTVIAKKNHQQQQEKQQKQHRFMVQPELKNPNKPHSSGGCSSLTKQQLKVKANLMSAQNKHQNNRNVSIVNQTKSISEPYINPSKLQQKGALKLRFHHQALPPVYLNHYENTNRQNNLTRNTASSGPKKSTNNQKSSSKRPPSKNTQENVRSWLQKIADIQRAAEQNKRQQQNCDVNNNVKNYKNPEVPQNTTTKASVTTKSLASRQVTRNIQQKVSIKSEVKYSNLPYMGEITLNNSKPRRGRKPKKADICHLIYKNYGTIVPGTTINDEIIRNSLNASTVQTNFKNYETCEEPLNLCLRDQSSSDSFSISSSEESPNFLKTETATTNDSRNINQKDTMENLVPDTTKIPADTTSNLIQHSISMYYHKLLESGIFLNEDGKTVRIPIETIEKDNQLALKIPIPSGLFPLTTTTIEKQRVSPTSTTRDFSPTISILPLKTNSTETIVTGTATNESNLQIQLVTPKRKRSAIFIPPMPAENSSTPPTEVSICKFKFTGGAKPSLQEKKMLSVDSEGNYRFYNGSAEKVPYECLSRDQQSQSQINANYNGSNEKIFLDITPPSSDLSHELLQLPPPESSPTSVLLQPMCTMLVPDSDSNRSYTTNLPPHHSPKSAKVNFVNSTMIESLHKLEKKEANDRKRKLRRSTQREKFEKNFSENGFLIQTQQLQSAEGSTYCKFRQLKKFTRYLFRNWKDYLPSSTNCTTTSETNKNLMQSNEPKTKIVKNYNQMCLDTSSLSYNEKNNTYNES